MQETGTHPALQPLVELQLITAEEHQKALAYPDLAALPQDLPPAELLRWMIHHKLTTEEALTPMRALLASELSDAQRTQRRQIAADTAEALRQWERQLTEQSLLTLRDLQVLTLDQHAEALAASEGKPPLASPALALLWINSEALLSPEDALALKARVAALPASASGDKARAVLAEHDTLAGEVNRVMRKAALHEVFPGGPWLWLAGFVLAMTAAGWYIFSPTAVPGCDDKNTLATLNGMFFRGSIAARTRDPLHALQTPSPGLPQVKEAKEVGFAKAHQLRGCTATLVIQDQQVPYAYTIGRGHPHGSDGPGDDNGQHKSDGFHVVGAEPRIVQARFAHLTEDGDYAHQAAPLGRPALEKAFREGVATLHSPSAGLSAMLARQRALSAGRSSLVDTSADREREIAEIEPLADCQPEAGGQGQRCRLLVERNDPLMAAIGTGGSTVFEGEFSFQRTGADAPWTVTDSFAEEFGKAVVKGRVDSLRAAADDTPPPPVPPQAKTH